jgi:hypothetical protein
VARALCGRVAYPVTHEESGPLFETFLLNEIRCYLAYAKRPYKIHFWRNYNGIEVAFLCETTAGFVAAEFKSANRWDKRFNRGLQRMRSELGLQTVSCYGVYLGDRAALWDEVQILPVGDFLEKLWNGDILQ